MKLICPFSFLSFPFLDFFFFFPSNLGEVVIDHFCSYFPAVSCAICHSLKELLTNTDAQHFGCFVNTFAEASF